jgi:hypothetical protein
MSKQNHPWRKGRSGRFAAYLESLPPPERQQVEAAERAFIYKATMFSSPWLAVARDYAESLRGVC